MYAITEGDGSLSLNFSWIRVNLEERAFFGSATDPARFEKGDMGYNGGQITVAGLYPMIYPDNIPLDYLLTGDGKIQSVLEKVILYWWEMFLESALKWSAFDFWMF